MTRTFSFIQILIYSLIVILPFGILMYILANKSKEVSEDKSNKKSIMQIVGILIAIIFFIYIGVLIINSNLEYSKQYRRILI